jgi:hypothetical protein
MKQLAKMRDKWEIEWVGKYSAEQQAILEEVRVFSEKYFSNFTITKT